MTAATGGITRGDFDLRPFIASRNDRAAWQILNTLLPYGLIWWLTFKACDVCPWLVPPLILLLSLFSVRCFSLMHDCGHHSLFRSQLLNRIAGFLLGLVNGVPQVAWSRDHAYHHRTNGDWDRYRSVIDMLSVDEFEKLSPLRQRLYAILRHPLMAFPGGFYYLAIKPRQTLIQGLLASPAERPWASRAEGLDLLLSSLAWLGGLMAIGSRAGYGRTIGLYAVVLTLSAAIFLYVFFVQHIFEGSYAHRSEGWSSLQAALKGTSLLQLPPLLQWFTADIGYHNIHHLCERIPNYQLRACHQVNQHLLRDVPVITIATMLKAAAFLLWDRSLDRLVTIPSGHVAEPKV